MKIVKLLIALALLPILQPGSAIAQDETYFYGAPWIGTAFFAGSIGTEVSGSLAAAKSKISNAPAYGAFVGLRLNSRFGIEAVFSYLPSTILTDVATNEVSPKFGYDLNIVVFGGNLAYAFSTSKTSIIPYLTAGAGAVSFSPDKELFADEELNPKSSTDFMFNFGAGLDIPISDVVLMKIDLRDYITSTTGSFALFPDIEGNKSTIHMIVLSAGVMFRSR